MRQAVENSVIHYLARELYGTVRDRLPKVRGRKRMGHAVARWLSTAGAVTVRSYGLRFQLDLREHVEEQIFWEDYDRSTVLWWRSQMRPGDLVLDVGANVGLYSLVAASAGAKVVAFEPNPRTRERLERNVELNGLRDSITICDEAVSDTEGEAVLFDDVNEGAFGANAGVASLSSRNAGGRGLPVRVSTLDTVCARLGLRRADWMKMDIQGAELAALRGATNLLTTLRPNLILEIDPNASRNMGWSERDLRGILEPHGYSLRRLDGMNVLAECERKGP